MLEWKTGKNSNFAFYKHGLRSIILIYFFIIYALPGETKIGAVTEVPGEIHCARNHRSISQFIPFAMRNLTLLVMTKKYKTYFVIFRGNPQTLKFCCYMHGLDST